jgi:hypothetical protein
MYYDSFEQEALRDGPLRVLDEALIRHAQGTRLKNVAYEWTSLWALSQSEQAANNKTFCDAAGVLNNMGRFAPEELRPAVADVLVDQNYLPTLDAHLLTQEEIEEQQAEEPEEPKQLPASG